MAAVKIGPPRDHCAIACNFIAALGAATPDECVRGHIVSSHNMLTIRNFSRLSFVHLVEV